MKRSIAKADWDLERALANIHDLHQAFDGVHPEYVEALEVMAMGLVVVQAGLRDFWAAAWGTPPDSFEGYRV